MFSFSGCTECVHIIQALVATLEELPLPRSLDDLLVGRDRFLAGFQPNSPRVEGKRDIVCTDPEVLQTVATHFNHGLRSEGIPKLVTHVEGNAGLTRTVAEMLTAWKSRDAEVAELFHLAVHLVASGNSEWAVGGTTSTAVGVVWINPDVGWSERDYFEVFVHELTHTLLFWDELRYTHYPRPDLIRDRRLYTKSAILRVPRPIDRVFHSVLVAAEVVAVRRRLGLGTAASAVHPPSEALVSQALASIAEIEGHVEKKRLLSDRGFNLLSACAMLLNQMSSEMATAV